MKRGPEIKLPKLAVPAVLVDLYFDLRDRHLLPVVGILLIGIVAIPLLLGGSTEDSGSASETEVSTGGNAKQSALLVTEATPGLRRSNRLRHLTPRDPFQPASRAGKGKSGATESSAGASSDEVETEPTEAGTGPVGSEPANAPVETKTKVTYFSVAIDIRVVPISSAAGKPSNAEPYIRRNLPPLTMLPSRETPAFTYMGPSRDGRKALMVVSSHVTSLFGDSACVIGGETCQLLALEPGLPETLLWGSDGLTYKFELLKLHLVASDHLNRAPLGKPKHR